MIFVTTKEVVGTRGFTKSSSVPVFCAETVQTVTAIPSARRISFSFIDDTFFEAFGAIQSISQSFDGFADGLRKITGRNLSSSGIQFWAGSLSGRWSCAGGRFLRRRAEQLFSPINRLVQLLHRMSVIGTSQRQRLTGELSKVSNCLHQLVGGELSIFEHFPHAAQPPRHARPLLSLDSLGGQERFRRLSNSGLTSRNLHLMLQTNGSRGAALRQEMKGQL